MLFADRADVADRGVADGHRRGGGGVGGVVVLADALDRPLEGRLEDGPAAPERGREAFHREPFCLAERGALQHPVGCAPEDGEQRVVEDAGVADARAHVGAVVGDDGEDGALGLVEIGRARIEDGAARGTDEVGRRHDRAAEEADPLRFGPRGRGLDLSRGARGELDQGLAAERLGGGGEHGVARVVIREETEDHVGVTHCTRDRAGHVDAQGLERSGAGSGAVPDRDAMTCLREDRGEDRSHPARAEDGDVLGLHLPWVAITHGARRARHDEPGARSDDPSRRARP